MRRSWVEIHLAAVLTVALCAATPSATGQVGLDFRPCPSERGMSCATLSVPLDRASPGPRLALPVRRVAASRSSQGTIILLAGGPGEAAIASGGRYERLIANAAPNQDVVVFDQRGTGSTALRCPSLGAASDARDLARATARCADEIGPQRAHYTTADSVADIEALRAGLGAETVTLVGVSYGTHVAQAYARTYPARVRGLVLDSVVGPRGQQLVDADVYRAARRALSEVCRGAECRGITVDARRDVARLTRRLQRRALVGKRVNLRGVPQRAAFGGPRAPRALFDLFSIGDLSPAVRQAFPSAVRAAVAGDPAPLLRLDAYDPEVGDQPQHFSTALLTTTLCQDAALPWDASMPGSARIAARQRAFLSTPATVFAPFARPGGDDLLGNLCILWPEAGASPAPTAPLPDVPAVLFSGTQDVRTPLESARRVAAEMPRAHVLPVAGAGHSVLSRGDACVRENLRRFFAGASRYRRCSDWAAPASSTPVPPRRIGVLRPVAGVSGTRGRTLRAVRFTMNDVGDAMALGRMVRVNQVAFAGLRRGSGTVTIVGSRLHVRLRGFEYVPGVRVSGTARISQTGRARKYDLVISGPAAAAGHVQVRGNIARGTLGGKRFRAVWPRDTVLAG